MDYLRESSCNIAHTQSEIRKAMESVLGKDFSKMTDKEIDKTAREIADKGYTAMVKKNKDGYLILKQKCEIVRKENVSTDKEL